MGISLSVARVSTLFLQGCETAEGRTSSKFCFLLRVMFTFLLSSNWYLLCSYCYSSGSVTLDKSKEIVTKFGLFEWKSKITGVQEIPLTDSEIPISAVVCQNWPLKFILKPHWFQYKKREAEDCSFICIVTTAVSKWIGGVNFLKPTSLYQPCWHLLDKGAEKVQSRRQKKGLMELPESFLLPGAGHEIFPK